MRAISALIKREYLEHRIAFLYVPIALLVILSLAIVYFIFTGDGAIISTTGPNPAGLGLYRVGIGGAFLLWSLYLLVGLFFYYADSFSADRRNNALLFWKSMPQSDLKVLTSKSLAGITVFMTMILGFALVTAALAYLFLLSVAAQYPVVVAPSLLQAAMTLAQMTVVGVLYFVLVLLWYAPCLAWVAGLSTLFQRWSIPLAILIPGIVILLEYLNSLRLPGTGRPIADFLSWRTDGFVDQDVLLAALFRPDGRPFDLIPMLISGIDLLHTAIGIAFTVLVVYLASEYRRRRIQA